MCFYVFVFMFIYMSIVTKTERTEVESCVLISRPKSCGGGGLHAVVIFPAWWDDLCKVSYTVDTIAGKLLA